jgi:hypothetical protein
VESTLFIIWFGATAVDAVGCALVIWPLYRLNTRFGRFLAVCLAGVAVESVVASVSLMLWWTDGQGGVRLDTLSVFDELLREGAEGWAGLIALAGRN